MSHAAATRGADASRRTEVRNAIFTSQHPCLVIVVPRNEPDASAHEDLRVAIEVQVGRRGVTVAKLEASLAGA